MDDVAACPDFLQTNISTKAVDKWFCYPVRPAAKAYGNQIAKKINSKNHLKSVGYNFYWLSEPCSFMTKNNNIT
jgi:hypothetical protein